MGGYIYTTRYLHDLGIPPGSVSYAPHEFALSAAPLFLALFFALPGIVLLLSGMLPPPRANLLMDFAVVLGQTIGIVAVLASIGVVGLTEFENEAEPSSLRVLLFTAWGGVIIALATAPLVVHLMPRLGVIVYVTWAVLFFVTAAPSAIGEIDAQLTLRDGFGTRPATIFVSSSLNLSDTLQIEGDVLMIRSDLLYFITDEDGGPAVQVVPLAEVLRIEYSQ